MHLPRQGASLQHLFDLSSTHSRIYVNHIPSPLLLPLLPAAVLAAWLWVAWSRTRRELSAFDGFEGLHLEPQDFRTD